MPVATKEADGKVETVFPGGFEKMVERLAGSRLRWIRMTNS